MTKETFLSFYKGKTNYDDAGECYDQIVKALEEFGILTNMTIIGALATVRVEVGISYKPIMELASGRQYEGRRDLGNHLPGDGVKFKGRGFIQLTGRANYAYYANKLGLDLINNPDIALGVVNSARILALYFKDRKVNTFCDRRDWERVRRRVNGGLNGYDVFKRVVNDFLVASSIESIK